MYTDKSLIESWLKKNRISKYTINEDLTVDVAGSVHLMGKKLLLIPVQFGKVLGSFNIKQNQLTSLKGCPHFVGGDFICSNNKLTTLEYGPKTVFKEYDCSYNKLLSLEHSPNSTGIFTCSHNLLISFKGGPKIVKGNAYCQNNKFETLKDAPVHIFGDLYLEDNPTLKTLENKILKLTGVIKVGFIKSNGIKKYQYPEFKNEYSNEYELNISLDKVNRYYMSEKLHAKLQKVLQNKPVVRKVKI